MSMKLFEMKKARHEAIEASQAIINGAAYGKRELTAEEARLFDANMAEVTRLNAKIQPIEDNPNNSILGMMRNNPGAFLGGDGPSGSNPNRTETPHGISTPGEHPMATEYRGKFAAFVNNSLSMLGGGSPQMEATAPSGPISVGTTSGWDSIGMTVPAEILPFLPSYYNLDSFALAGATQIITEHTRPLVKPIISAGAANAVFAENAAPSASQPFGMAGFTFGGTKYARLVLASYEALMNSELPLAGVILDELLSSLATTLTAATTTQFVSALTAPPGVSGTSPLAVGVGGSGGSIYTSMIDLRHAVPPRFDLPTNKWMLSRATLAAIRNTRANTSGVPMFSPDGTKLFDREYVLNDNLDATTGAGVGFVAFGSFADGVWTRKTPLMTRIFLELYAQNGQVGYRTQQWADSHFLAELAGAEQPPTFQPLYYTNVVSES